MRTPPLGVWPHWIGYLALGYLVGPPQYRTCTAIKAAMFLLFTLVI